MDDCKPVLQSVPQIWVTDWQRRNLSDSGKFAFANKDIGTLSHIESDRIFDSLR